MIFEKRNIDITLGRFLETLVGVILKFLLVVMVMGYVGLDTSGFAALIASGGLAIGLSLQGGLSNFAGGVLILLLKPFVVGDYIIEDNKGREGTVKEIQLFYTKLLTADNKTVIIPNGSLANTSLTNVTAQDKRRVDLSVGISYDADLKKAKQLIEELFRKDEDVLQEEGIAVFVDSLGESAVVTAATISAAQSTDEVAKFYDKDGIKGKRETSTMPGSAGSSWYFMRYIDPKNDK